MNNFPIENQQLELIEKFQNMDVLIIGSTEHPLFKCSDILEKVLEYKNPRSQPWIQKLKLDSEFVVSKMQRFATSSQLTDFLTEDGLYEVLFRSKQPLAKDFRIWIRNLLKQLRLGELQLVKSQLQQSQNQLQQSQNQLQHFQLQNFQKDKIIQEQGEQIEEMKQEKTGSVYALYYKDQNGNDIDIYTGQTKNEPFKRYGQHIGKFKKFLSYTIKNGDQLYLLMAAQFLLTGEIPEMKILEDNIPEEYLNNREQYYIEQINGKFQNIKCTIDDVKDIIIQFKKEKKIQEEYYCQSCDKKLQQKGNHEDSTYHQKRLNGPLQSGYFCEICNKQLQSKGDHENAKYHLRNLKKQQ